MASKTASSSAAAAANGVATLADVEAAEDSPTQDYKYQVEISQMMFVFGNVTDPHPDVTRLIEDIVRMQTIEMMIQSRRLAQRRGSKYLASEDLIFLIRYDRAKVNRLRTYLSWKDVRKNAKDSGDGVAGPGGPGGPDVDGLPDDAGTLDNPVRATKMKIRLPWEIGSVYGEFLRPINGQENEEEEDEQDLKAHEDSVKRLRDADEATRRMTREEYVHYSECRQASFTFRRAKRFREFIDAGSYLDVKPNDDIIDILGFLGFETVRELVVGAIAIKKGLEQQERERRRAAEVSGSSSTSARTAAEVEDTEAAIDGERQGEGRDKVEDETEGPTEADTSIETARGDPTPTGTKRKTPPPTRPSAAPTDPDPSSKRPRTDTTAPPPSTTNPPPSSTPTAFGPTSTTPLPDGQDATDPAERELCSLFTLRPTVEKPLKAAHIHEAFAKLQRDRAALTNGIRGAGGSGGLRRTRVHVI